MTIINYTPNVQPVNFGQLGAGEFFVYSGFGRVALKVNCQDYIYIDNWHSHTQNNMDEKVIRVDARISISFHPF